VTDPSVTLRPSDPHLGAGLRVVLFRAKTVADEPAPVVTTVQERAIRVQLAAEAMPQDGWVWLPGRPLMAATASCWLSRDPAANT
jgi:hypothetical protein